MANIEKKVGNGIQVKFDKNIKLSGSEIAKGGRQLVKQLTTTTVRVDQAIPVDLLSKIGLEVAQGLPSSGTGSHFIGKTRADKAAVKQILAPVHKIRQIYYTYYVSALTALEHKLKTPGIRATRHSVNEQLSIALRLGDIPGVGAVSDSINLPIKWRGLAKRTLAAKKLLRSNTFWRHTGQGHQAFSAEVRSKLSKTKPTSFMVSNMLLSAVSGSVNKKGAGRFVAKAHLSYKLGLPTWNKKMDALITLPMATGQAASVLTATSLNLYSKSLKYRELSGIDRILAAESRRPWIRNISIQVGQHMRQMAATGRVSAFSSSSLVSQAQQAYDQDKASALTKKVKRRRTYEDAYNNTRG